MDADDTDVPDEFTDLTEAAQSSLEFWDNPLDEADWSDVAPK
jgi:hypothetical protein